MLVKIVQLNLVNGFYLQVHIGNKFSCTLAQARLLANLEHEYLTS